MALRIVVADDHPVILAGASEALAPASEVALVGVAANSTELIAVLSANEIDVAVTDFSMPGGAYGDGISLLGFIQRRFPGLPLVVLTGTEGRQILDSIRHVGVTCIVSKADAMAELLRAIQAAATGGAYLSTTVSACLQSGEGGGALSRRESEVLRMVAEGLSQAHIAQRLQRSRQTISSQKRSAMRKLGLSTMADVYDYAVAHGWVGASQAARLRAFHSQGPS
ncbi:response regulator [Stenotrophomonas indicatrix]|uniref:response regulator n=1 Tax=Stenotrophomonas indicatrix TaxID=2045451 RepID=UPI003008B0E3